MKRAAIFVEGQTEAAFVRRLFIDLAGSRGIRLIGEKQFKGIFSQEYATGTNNDQYQVLIANCCNDEKVMTAIKDRYAGLESAGYDVIIGLRDLFPLTHLELSNLKAGMQSVTPTGQVPTTVVVAVAEVEAWFIEEITHFARVDPALTEASILLATGYGLSSRTAETLPHPAEALHQAYQVANLAWRKKENQIARTVNSLDIATLHGDARNHSQSLDEFLGIVDAFLN